jgi:hypothetical protein
MSAKETDSFTENYCYQLNCRMSRRTVTIVGHLEWRKKMTLTALLMNTYSTPYIYACQNQNVMSGSIVVNNFVLIGKYYCHFNVVELRKQENPLHEGYEEVTKAHKESIRQMNEGC